MRRCPSETAVSFSCGMKKVHFLARLSELPNQMSYLIDYPFGFDFSNFKIHSGPNPVPTFSCGERDMYEYSSSQAPLVI